MTLDSGVNEMFQVRFTNNQEVSADTGEHLGTLGCGVGASQGKGKLFALGGADKSELGFGTKLLGFGGRGGGWSNHFFVHGADYTPKCRICQL
jgi:hypothetical protein